MPAERFIRAEAGALRPVAGMASFQALRDLVRTVQSDCVVEVDGNSYSMPGRLIGERVRVAITADELRITHAGRQVAYHVRQAGRHGARCRRGTF